MKEDEEEETKVEEEKEEKEEKEDDLPSQNGEAVEELTTEGATDQAMEGTERSEKEKSATPQNGIADIPIDQVRSFQSQSVRKTLTLIKKTCMTLTL